MPKKRTISKPEAEHSIPMIWSFPEDLVSGYATNILVQINESELYVSFFEVPPPVIFAPEDAKKIESVKAKCIARVVISPDRMAKFIEVMQQQLNIFNQKKATKLSAKTK